MFFGLTKYFLLLACIFFSRQHIVTQTNNILSLKLHTAQFLGNLLKNKKCILHTQEQWKPLKIFSRFYRSFCPDTHTYIPTVSVSPTPEQNLSKGQSELMLNISQDFILIAKFLFFTKHSLEQIQQVEICMFCNTACRLVTLR